MDLQLSGPARKGRRRGNSQPAPPLPANRPASPIRLDRSLGNQIAGRLIQAKLKVGQSGDLHETQADQAADQMTAMRDSAVSAAREGAQAALIVEDDSQQIGPSQMRKTEFLSRLRRDVCRESEEAMKGSGRTTDGCPYVEKWFGYYADKDSTYIERSLRKYAPEAVAATTASDYIPLVAARVRRSVEVWAQTGEITGVPDELAGAIMGGGILGAITSVASTIGRAIGSVVSGIGSVISGIGSLFFKGRDGSPIAHGDSSEVGGVLSGGSSLDGQVRQRMEGAFGHDFSGVRIHTDSQAAGLSAGMNARAFTIGQQIAFGPGEYQPGTMIGDALIAHELAHVAQQSGAGAGEAILQKGEDGTSALEEDADISAVKAVVSMWGGKNAKLTGIAQRAMPSLRSGLRLQRCGGPSVPGPRLSADCTGPQRDKLQMAYNLAQTWVGIARLKVEEVIANPAKADESTLSHLKSSFHIQSTAESIDEIRKVQTGLAAIQAAFGGAVPFQCEKKPDPSGAEASTPSTDLGFIVLHGDIHLYPRFFEDTEMQGVANLTDLSILEEHPEKKTPEEKALEDKTIKETANKERAEVVIHEMAHKYIDCVDKAYYFRERGKYERLSTKELLGNADSYAHFARFVVD